MKAKKKKKEPMLQNPGGNYFQLKVGIFKLLTNCEDRIKTLEDMHGKCTEILLVFQEATNVCVSPKGRNKPTKRRMGSRKQRFHPTRKFSR